MKINHLVDYLRSRCNLILVFKVIQLVSIAGMLFELCAQCLAYCMYLKLLPSFGVITDGEIRGLDQAR
jgi:hypothetical protein